MNLINNKINDKKMKISWTPERIALIKKYKGEGLSYREIASLMDLTISSISCACNKFRILLDKETRKKRMSEAGFKGIKNRIKKYNLTEITPELIEKVRELKSKNLENQEISKKLSISFNTVAHICTDYQILLDEKTRKKRKRESGIKGGQIFKNKRENLAKIHSFDENLGYIIGVCFGDGSAVDLGRRGYLELRTIDESFAKTFYNALLTYTNQKPSYYIYTHDKVFKKENRIYKNVKYHEVFFYNVFFVRNLREIFGSTSKWDIDVDRCLSYGEKFCIGFIKGMFDSEGSFWIDKKSITPSASLEFSSINKEGTTNFCRLLQKIGYDFRINFINKSNGLLEVKIRSAKLSLIKKYFYEIGFSIERKQKRLAEFIRLRNL